MSDIKKYMDLAFITLWEKYLHTTKNILEETIKNGNQHMISHSWTYDANNKVTYTRWFSENSYEEATKWSDFNILVPTLFLFYHWIELILKGLLILQWKEFLANHKLSVLFSDIQNEKNSQITEILNKYLVSNNMVNLMKEFLANNNQTIDEFYIILRYPSSKDLEKIYHYTQLKYLEGELLPFVIQAKSDIDELLYQVVRQYDLEKQQ